MSEEDEDGDEGIDLLADSEIPTTKRTICRLDLDASFKMVVSVNPAGALCDKIAINTKKPRPSIERLEARATPSIKPWTVRPANAAIPTVW